MGTNQQPQFVVRFGVRLCGHESKMNRQATVCIFLQNPPCATNQSNHVSKATSTPTQTTKNNTHARETARGKWAPKAKKRTGPEGEEPTGPEGEERKRKTTGPAGDERAGKHPQAKGEVRGHGTPGGEEKTRGAARRRPAGEEKSGVRVHGEKKREVP
jgi:hypothetical protein